MVDQKITDLTPLVGTIALTDLAEMTDDPGGSPLSRSVTFQQVADVVRTDAAFDDFISFSIRGLLVNETVFIAKDVPFAFTIDSTKSQSASGTCTATFKNGTTALGGTANAVSSASQTQVHASANTFAIGDALNITISANSACNDAVFHLAITRA